MLTETRRKNGKSGGKGARYKKAKDVETEKKVHILFPDVRKLADDVMLVQKSLDGGCEVDRNSHRVGEDGSNPR